MNNTITTPAHAQTVGGTPTAQGGFDFYALLPLVLMVAVFYFLLIRPQQKKAKKQQEMLSGLRRGDRVVTSGGIIGSIVKVVSDTELSVEIADGVTVRVLRSAVGELLAKTEPAAVSSKAQNNSSKDRDKSSDAERPANTPAEESHTLAHVTSRIADATKASAVSAKSNVQKAAIEAKHAVGKAAYQGKNVAKKAAKSLERKK